jgi:hypothetical protein
VGILQNNDLNKEAKDKLIQHIYKLYTNIQPWSPIEEYGLEEDYISGIIRREAPEFSYLIRDLSTLTQDLIDKEKQANLEWQMSRQS